MDYISILQHSIETSIYMNFFKLKEEASLAHIYKSKLVKFSLNLFESNVYNFDSIRLQKSAILAYPLSNRPRGIIDINSVKFHQKQLKKKELQPIWILLKDKKYILLDGAHRIVASYIEKKSYIYAFIIKI